MEIFNFFYVTKIENLCLEPSSSAIGYLDSINVLNSTSVNITGWALVRNADDLVLPDKIFIAENNHLVGYCKLNIPREDVIDAHGLDSDLICCGFSCDVPVRDIVAAANSLSAHPLFGAELSSIPGPYATVFPSNPLEYKCQLTDALVRPERMNSLAISITSKCNLKCKYCFIHCAEYIAMDMDNYLLNSIMLQINDLSVNEVHFGIMGEPTVFQKFFDLADSISSTGIRTSVATNLSKMMSMNEIDSLLNFYAIEVSVDTFDYKNLKFIRTHADSRIILFNLIRIYARAIVKKIKPPIITLSIVCNQLNIPDLMELSAICTLLRIPQVQLLDMRLPYHWADFSHLPPRVCDAQNKDDMRQTLIEVMRFLNDSGVRTSVDASLTAFIEGSDEDGGLDPLTDEKTTRFCIAPWSRLYINADGTATPCFYFSAIGKITSQGHIQDTWNSTRMIQLRNELLSGNLISGCQSCCRAKACTISDLQELVSRYLSCEARHDRAETFGQPVDFYWT